jgi:outer membrane lipoprotein carrier protein
MTVLPLLLLTLLVPQDDADKAIDRAVAAYAKIRTAKATFEQTVTNPLTGSALKSRGEFEQQRPNRFAFRFSDPKGDLIVSDGKYVWAYLPSSAPGQVIRAPLAAEAAGSLDLIGEFFSNPRSRYAIADGGPATVDGHAVRVVTLAPKSSDAAFTRAKVWIDVADGTLRQFEAVETSGITRTVHITSFSPNAAVSPSAFVYKPGRGVKIVER